MKYRVSKKQGRQRKGIGRDQLCNVRLEQQIREVEAELKRRGVDLSEVDVEERPVVQSAAGRDEFPFRMQVVDAQTDEVLWETVVTGPGPVDVPGFYPRKVAAVILSKDGGVTREDPPQSSR